MTLESVNYYRLFPVRPRLSLLELWCVLILLFFMGAKAHAAGGRPDLMVKLASEGEGRYLGEGVFESTAVTQSRSQPSFPGTAASFRLLLKNAGDSADSFLVRGTGSDSWLSVSYLDQGGADRSSLVSGPGYATATLPPGGSVSFLVQVAPSSLPLGASYRVTVSAVSVSAPSRIDQVKTETVACTLAAAVTVTAPPDDSGFPGSVVNYPYAVTNVGGSANSFTLSAGGSGAWPVRIYADDGAGGGIASDGVRQGGELREISSTGPLAPGEGCRFFVAVTVPESSADRARNDTVLSVAGAGANGSDQVSTSAVAAVITVAEELRNLTTGGVFAANAEALPGDTLEYRMTITNSGSLPATSVAFDTPLPESTVCLPGSLWIGSSPGGDAPHCAAAECGFVRESGGGIAARLGEGASETAGGSLSPGKTLYVYFRARLE